MNGIRHDTVELSGSTHQRWGSLLSDYEVRLKTKFGDLVLHFDNQEDLEKKLKEAQGFSHTIETYGTGLYSMETPKPIPGYEDLYAITVEGGIRLLKLPKKDRDIIRLLVFLSDRSLNSDQIRQMTGIANPLANMGDHFLKLPDDTYTLTPEGRTEVVSKIVPTLRRSKAKE